jgi:hypothetical protein
MPVVKLPFRLILYYQSDECNYKYLSAVLMTLGLQSVVHLQIDFSLLLAEHLESPMEMNAAGLPFLIISNSEIYLFQQKPPVINYAKEMFSF